MSQTTDQDHGAMPVCIVLTEGIEYNTVVPRFLWHYTDGAGLRGILQTQTLWASNCLFLNDSAEFKFAGEVITKVLDEVLDVDATAEVRRELVNLRDMFALAHPDITPDIYVCSFTTQGDLLSQWRGYTKPRDRFNIGINGPYLFARGFESWQLRECFYQDMRQRLLVSDVVRRCLSYLDAGVPVSLAFRRLAYSLAWLAPLLKHPRFAEENEWRLIRYPRELVRFPEEYEPPVEHRPRQSTSIPYITFPLNIEQVHVPPIHITIGPSTNALSENDVIVLAAENGLVATTSLSEVPLRDWPTD